MAGLAQLAVVRGHSAVQGGTAPGYLVNSLGDPFQPAATHIQRLLLPVDSLCRQPGGKQHRIPGDQVKDILYFCRHRGIIYRKYKLKS